MVNSPLRMPPKCWFYTSTTTYQGIPSGAGFVPINLKPLVRPALSGSPSVFLQTAADVARGFRVSETASFPHRRRCRGSMGLISEVPWGAEGIPGGCCNRWVGRLNARDPETNSSSHLRIGGRNTTFLLGPGHLQVQTLSFP